MRLDLADITKAVDALLTVTESPRQRRILLNFRRHALLEVSGRWREILVPSMTVRDPRYRIDDRGVSTVFDGMAAVAGFYAAVAAAGLTVFGPLSEQVMVSDSAYAAESVFGQIMPGRLLVEEFDVHDPDAHYLFVHEIAMFWPYTDDGLLVGEHIYEVPGSRRVYPLHSDDVITPAQAAAALAPLIDDEPSLIAT
jgi:hypothetical protein